MLDDSIFQVSDSIILSFYAVMVLIFELTFN